MKEELKALIISKNDHFLFYSGDKWRQIAHKGTKVKPMLVTAAGDYIGYSWGDTSLETLNSAASILRVAFGGLIAFEHALDVAVAILAPCQHRAFIVTSTHLVDFLLHKQLPDLSAIVPLAEADARRAKQT